MALSHIGYGLIFFEFFCSRYKSNHPKKVFSVELLCKRDEGIGIPDECCQYHHLK
jgi:hypothetical protein